MDQGQASSGVATAARKKPGGPRFELVKEIRHGVWIAVRPGDPRGEKYLARPVEDFMKLRKGSDTAAWEKLRDEHNQAHVVAQILNHENLVSLVGRIDSRPFSKIQKNSQTQKKDEKLESYLVWDYCDAANLSALFREHPCKDYSYYLPESLCWHVLRALTRAVTYLHDGKRLRFDEGLLPGASRAWRTADADWLSILHRAIEPANIYFQHPRGTETYGQCKLANFSKATVTSHVANVKKKLGAKPSGMSMARYRGNEPLIETMGKYFREPKDDSMEDDSVEYYPLEDSSVVRVELLATAHQNSHLHIG
ncbi:hypothetical protein BKA56DRAFT_51946 [Ilyonectria sp. MPI-CAGE-AT-0026]|nr:hypothetical protein BKA56DRAFT_51946 [Ilyonectria sp. MPI-CAGE-AT-0026]